MKFFNGNNNNIKIRQMYCGADCCMILTLNNECYTFGYNRFGQIGNNSRHDTKPVINPYLLRLKDSNEYIIKANCGLGHYLLLTNKNNVYSFGLNDNNQCTTSIKDMFILLPHLLNKKEELKLVYNNFMYFVCDVLAFDDNSIIFVDPCTAKKFDQKMHQQWHLTKFKF